MEGWRERHPKHWRCLIGLALHDIERGAKVAEVYDEKGKPLARRRLGVITKVNYANVNGSDINPDATSGDVHSVEVTFAAGEKPKTFRGTNQLALHQKADQAALEKINETAQTRVAIDGRRSKIEDALGIGQGPKIAPNDADMGLRRK